MKPSVASRLVRTFLTTAFAGCLLFSPSAAWAICGDGDVEEIEECDDANSTDDDCCSNECKAAQVESFCTDGNDCTFDYCDGSGFCFSFPNQQGECDDGNACTVGDFCNSDGFCTSDGSLEDGQFCGDESLCGGGGTCFNSFCFGDPVDCEGYGVCNSAVCNPDTRSCEVEPLADDTPCDSPHPCTDPGVCQNGECQQPPTDCSDFADACNDAFCDGEAGGCFSVPKENGTQCDDTNGCTNPGNCDDGECITTPKDCSSFADQCNDAACDQKTEEGCFALPKEDGTPCDDDANCTIDDVCTEGACGGTEVDCSEEGDDCNIPFCNPQTGECETTPVEVPTNCDDGNPCTTGEQCRGSVCAGGESIDCSDFDTACTTGVCNVQTGDCEALPNQDGGECDDGDNCTLGDTCVEGECTGTPRDCSGSADQCNTGVCNGDTGGCESVPVEEPAECNDGNLCTSGDSCSNGECAGTPSDCSVFDGQCVEGRCNRDSGNCEGVPLEDGSSCTDGSPCTTGDECSDGTCEGTPKDCSASGGNCIVGECNPDTGQCVGEPAENGTSCSDGNPCTVSDSCTAGSCTSGAAKDCSGLDAPCKSGACNVQSGLCEAVNEADNSPCNDGAFCTATDTCTAGVCSGTGDACTGALVCNGQCNEVTDSCNAPSGTACESDGNPCTDDVCDGEGNCDAQANDGGCDDGLFCTTADHCADGLCIGEAVCPQTTACGDTCDEANDACRTCGHPFSNSRCIVNAIFVLQGALDLRECELCTCDVDSSGDVMATDALMILRTCTNLPVPLDCPSGEPTTTTTTVSTTTTLGGGCESELHNRIYNEKYTCAQAFTEGDPFCADLNEQDTIQFTHVFDGIYQVRDVPDSGFVVNGLYDCSTFTWSGGQPGEYAEGGVWTFSEDQSSFTGNSAYVAEDQSYAGGCNETGAESPAVPPNPEPIPPCDE